MYHLSDPHKSSTWFILILSCATYVKQKANKLYTGHMTSIYRTSKGKIEDTQFLFEHNLVYEKIAGSNSSKLKILIFKTFTNFSHWDLIVSPKRCIKRTCTLYASEDIHYCNWKTGSMTIHSGFKKLISTQTI